MPSVGSVTSDQVGPDPLGVLEVVEGDRADADPRSALGELVVLVAPGLVAVEAASFDAEQPLMAPASSAVTRTAPPTPSQRRRGGVVKSTTLRRNCSAEAVCSPAGAASQSG